MRWRIASFYKNKLSYILLCRNSTIMCSQAYNAAIIPAESYRLTYKSIISIILIISVIWCHLPIHSPTLRFICHQPNLHPKLRGFYHLHDLVDIFIFMDSKCIYFHIYIKGAQLKVMSFFLNMPFEVCISCLSLL